MSEMKEFKKIAEKFNYKEKWPTYDEIKECTKAEDKFIREVAEAIEKMWNTHMSLIPLSLNDLEVAYDNVRDFKLEKEIYTPRETFFKYYYSNIERKIAESLYHDHKNCLTLEELQNLIPFLNSPYYRRERIMLNYLKRMELLKHRGEEWLDTIILMEQILLNCED